MCKDLGRLALEAVSSPDGLGALWAALEPHAKRIAKGQLNRKRVSKSDVDDLAQEILLRVPRVVETLSKKIDSINDGNLAGWVINSLSFNAMEISRDIRNKKLVSSTLKDGSQIDWEEPKYEALPDIECVYCGKMFAQLNADTFTCSGPCNRNFALAQKAMRKTSNECLHVLECLRSGSQDYRVPANQVGKRIAMLRAMGYVIELERLISEPSDSRPFEHRFAITYFAESSPELKCANCGKGYTFSGARKASNYCSGNCQVSHWGQRKRAKNKVQVEPSCSHP